MARPRGMRFIKIKHKNFIAVLQQWIGGAGW